jgi:CRP-like cAMP-binding protein
MPLDLKNKSYDFKKGHVLYKEGEPITKNIMGLIVSGKVSVTYRLEGGKTIKFIVPAGGFVGIFEVLSGQTAWLTDAEVIEDSTISFWLKDDFILDVSMVPELGMKSIVYLSTFLRTLNKKIQEIG